MQTESGSRGPTTKKQSFKNLLLVILWSSLSFVKKTMYMCWKSWIKFYQIMVELAVGCENVRHYMRDVLHGHVQGLAMHDGGEKMSIVRVNVEVVSKQDLIMKFDHFKNVTHLRHFAIKRYFWAMMSKGQGKLLSEHNTRYTRFFESLPWLLNWNLLLKIVRCSNIYLFTILIRL